MVCNIQYDLELDMSSSPYMTISKHVIHQWLIITLFLSEIDGLKYEWL